MNGAAQIHSGSRSLALLRLAMVVVAAGDRRLSTARAPAAELSGRDAGVGDSASSASSSTTRGSTPRGAGAGRSSRFATCASRAAGDATPFLTARGASVGLSAFDLLRADRRAATAALDRLTFEGTELTLVQNRGAARTVCRAHRKRRATQACRASAARHRRARARQPRAVSRCERAAVAWTFQDVAASMRRDRRYARRSRRARGRRASLRQPHRAHGAGIHRRRRRRRASSRAIGGVRRHRRASISRSRRVCSRPRPWCRRPATATSRCGSSGKRASSRAARRSSRLPTWRCRARSARSTRGFERIALSGDWQRADEAWRFALRDVAVTRAGRAWPEARDGRHRAS